MKRNEIPIKRQVILDAMEEFPNIPKRKLARIIYARNPDGYISIETLRSSIRYYTGNEGTKSRKAIINKNGKYIQYPTKPE